MGGRCTVCRYYVFDTVDYRNPDKGGTVMGEVSMGAADPLAKWMSEIPVQR